ncbi:MAG: plasmid recombination protein [Ruminococcus sp.]|nr:plasmid recombination protein [Ruminococcus sp.]
MKSISHCQGKGSLSHNNREFHPKNSDIGRTPDNITFVKEPIGAAYEKLFGAAVERYNAKQKRSDRKIKNGYYEYQFNHKISQNVVTSPDKWKSFYEDVVQIGTMKDTAVGTSDAEIAKKCLTEYMEDFQRRNTNFYVFNAVLHMDEATPHLHIDYIPVGHYKRGIDTQNGIAQALKEMGFGEGKNAIAKWRKSEYEVLREICVRRGIEISEPKKGRGHNYLPDEYKIYQRELETIKSVLDMYRQILMQAENTEFPHTKMPFGKNVISDKSLEELSEKTAAVVALEQLYSIKEKELSEREKIVSEKEKNIDFLTESAEKSQRTALACERAAQRNEQKYFNLLSEQENLNELYRKAVFQRNDFERKFFDKVSECSNLKQVNENYKKELSEIKNNSQKKYDELKVFSDVKIDGLKTDKRRLCRYVADVAQAVVVLGHNTCGYENFFGNLTDKQRSLVLGVVDFCKNIVNDNGFPDLAEEMEKRGGMSDKIFKEYEIWREVFKQNNKTEKQKYYER